MFDYGQTCENGLFGSSMDAASPRMGCSVVPPWDIKSPPPLPLLPGGGEFLVTSPRVLVTSPRVLVTSPRVLVTPPHVLFPSHEEKWAQYLAI